MNLKRVYALLFRHSSTFRIFGNKLFVFLHFPLLYIYVSMNLLTCKFIGSMMRWKIKIKYTIRSTVFLNFFVFFMWLHPGTVNYYFTPIKCEIKFKDFVFSRPKLDIVFFVTIFLKLIDFC